MNCRKGLILFRKKIKRVLGRNLLWEVLHTSISHHGTPEFFTFFTILHHFFHWLFCK